jgi:DNA-binding YbaB/EbfC family protein
MGPDIQKMLKQAQKMQAQMMKTQEELHKKTVEGTAGGNMVTVTLNGANELVGIKLKPEVVDPADIEMLEDLIMAAFKTAQDQVKAMNEQAMSAVSGGMKIPGLM